MFALAVPAVVWGETAQGPVFYVPRDLSSSARERAIADALADWVLEHTHAGREHAARHPAAAGEFAAVLAELGPRLQSARRAPPAPARVG